MTQVAGLILLLFGVMAFVDRARPTEARSTYYLFDPHFGPRGRTISAFVLVVAGAALLLS